MDCHMKKPFRFEHMWMSDVCCSRTVEAVWREDSAEPWGTKIIKKVDKCGKELESWSRKNFGNVRRELEKKRQLLVHAEKQAIRRGDPKRMRQLEKEINVLMDKEAKMWVQRSWVLWLKDGDKNTRFFHSKASQRRRRNYINGLFDDSGSWTTNPTWISTTILNFYQQLFTSSNSSGFETVLESIPKLVTDEMNDLLIVDFTSKEIETALKQMAPLKSPGPDGMPPLFYQSYLSLLGEDIVQGVLEYLNSGSLPPSLCHSFINLIPKVESPKYISEYRPISLSNVLYRILAKVLANRLKKIMSQLISKHQSAFMLDRLITNNILVAFETLHYMRNHCTGKTGFMALKLDISKTYDRVEWVYMQQVLVKMGFHDCWVKLMMERITSATYSVLINGEPHGHIIPTRGLHQGDPLSPYLFLMCTEGLHGIISSATSKDEIRGVSICRSEPRITHLLFADDSLIFCRAKEFECQKLLDLLAIYEGASGHEKIY